ncbi:MAG: hypothetical protein HKO95_01050, partial [Rhodobacteraceae bacterium]|nr:hypothetical protein [Paracoccaceae bacterium]
MKRFLISLALMGSFFTSGAAHAAECFPMGGVGIPNFFSEGEGQPMIISATLTGTVQNAAGKILA